MEFKAKKYVADAKLLRQSTRHQLRSILSRRVEPLQRFSLPRTISGKFGVREHSRELERNAGGSRVQGRSSGAQEGRSEGGDRGRQSSPDQWREKRREGREKNDTWHRVERSSGLFMRRFRLPENAKMDQVKASMENGVLTVRVPKEEVKKPDVKSIEISG
ncbi:HSP20-like chaperones superfamily protein [Actinidia rufa]|uniref:HSP20-like chaperones superfamily protein n=1 Tax=Actinidia rufa TaxID=165716 RepID=A0A7J0HAQ9_9ERIC|nr:HSP20-like chaperones superfamily protein [Actinidia rufa]